MIRITVYSGPSTTDARPGHVTVREVAESEVTEELRKIGLEWKTADYMQQRQVVITLDPVVDVDEQVAQRAQELLRAAAAAAGIETD